MAPWYTVLIRSLIARKHERYFIAFGETIGAKDFTTTNGAYNGAANSFLSQKCLLLARLTFISLKHFLILFVEASGAGLLIEAFP